MVTNTLPCCRCERAEHSYREAGRTDAPTYTSVTGFRLPGICSAI